ncbi:MAG: hypothetical protein NW223_12585 [Hyphomicrobiaceae bacterium]|nr:hypothetical protein [Hyphomicrobiaceae bacterium]
MRGELCRRILRTPVSKLLYLLLLCWSGGLYVAAYVAAAHASQVLAGIAVAIAVLLATDQLPAAWRDLD